MSLRDVEMEMKTMYKSGRDAIREPEPQKKEKQKREVKDKEAFGMSAVTA